MKINTHITLPAEAEGAMCLFGAHGRLFVRLVEMFPGHLPVSPAQKGALRQQWHFAGILHAQYYFLRDQKHKILKLYYGQAIPVSKPRSKMESKGLLTTSVIQFI